MDNHNAFLRNAPTLIDPLFAPTNAKPRRHVTVDELFPPTPTDIERERQVRDVRKAAAEDRAQCAELERTSGEYLDWLNYQAMMDERL
ncbi:MAG: hypothetical protein KGL39_05555 [Patescibacteria group bacterium]|nr:hypothetical protein [Patescibacteria group bacterium]